jgi:hypothetical protein
VGKAELPLQAPEPGQVLVQMVKIMAVEVGAVIVTPLPLVALAVQVHPALLLSKNFINRKCK